TSSDTSSDGTAYTCTSGISLSASRFPTVTDLLTVTSAASLAPMATPFRMIRKTSMRQRAVARALAREVWRCCTQFTSPTPDSVLDWGSKNFNLTDPNLPLDPVAFVRKEPDRLRRHGLVELDRQ